MKPALRFLTASLILAAPLILTAPLSAQTTVRYWPGAHPKAELAQWAMELWAAASGGTMKVEKVKTAEEADIRFMWIDPQRKGLYGQAQTFREGGREVAEVVINPSIASLGPEMVAATAKDPLYGDVILFLTCVHESGHALGLPHTRQYADIMYSFEFGGDFVEYFGRYRRKLRTRTDMRKAALLSPGDAAEIKARALARTRK